MKVALITPKHKEDYLTNTVMDGLLELQQQDGNLNVHYCSDYSTYLPISSWKMNRNDFVEYARKSDLIIFFWGKDNTDIALAEEINEWAKTVYIDGSELGKNNRYNVDIIEQVKQMTYRGHGAIDESIKRRCAIYFRREKPYQDGIIPLPFGIERRYLKNLELDAAKDIDVVCIFGQEEYPPLRKEVRQYLENRPKADLKIITKPTNRKNFLEIFGLKKSDNGRKKFYNLLAKSKIGISVGGGGYDTARFWEILGNNCLLLTEKIDIFEPESSELDYKRIWQFADVDEFKKRFEELASYLKTAYNQKALSEEYRNIMEKHSTKARVLKIFSEAKKKGIIK